MRPSTGLFATVLAFTTAALAVPGPARADDSVGILVLKEHQTGTAAQHQPYVDKELVVLARLMGWASAKGSYQTTRSGADTYVKASKPRYGIYTLAAFLAQRDKYNLVVVGQELASVADGQQYFLVSKTATDAAGCKGKKLATDLGDDTRFVDKVVFDGKLSLSQFTLVTTARPAQAGKQVMAGTAACALVDDAELADLKQVSGGAAVKTLWTSAKLPPVVVAAFASAPAADRSALSATLPKLCQGDGKQVCVEMGITGYKAAGAADYAAVMTAYNR
ncbi:MAG TPA: PhnD/SsuA/transferrin family substrate-binding protein [Kofleriaceae bacterium]|nr:PhnD/SsuA/transferrin family substrate-binding protein [Kofleriaceae bacterium]